MTPVLVSKENCEVKFTMAFTAEEFTAAQKKVYNQQKGKFRIDGFRPGKAPQAMIERFYGEGIFFEDAIDELLASGYPTALDELGVEPVGRPELDLGTEPLKKGGGFTATLTVPVAPEVTVVDYKGVEAERRVHTVTEEDVKAELEAVQHRNARLVPVEEAAADGDTVMLDYAGFVGDLQFEGGTAENQSLKLGSGTFIPGFEDQLIGCKAGEEKDVKVTFPEDYHAEELAGKEAVFQCKIHEVKREELPAIDDELAADVSEFDTLEEYKADLKAKLEKEAADAAEYDGKNAVMEKIYAANSFDVPQIMIDNESENMLREFEQQLQYSGMTMEQYCGYLQKKPEDIKAEFAPDAEKRVKSRLIVAGIARQEGFVATEEEIEKEYVDLAQQYKLDVEKVKEFMADNVTELKKDICSRKAIDFIYAQAKLTDVDADAKKEEKTEE